MGGNINHYNNIMSPGTISTTSINPRLIEEDIDYQIRTLSPESTPLLSLAYQFGMGKPPTSHKIEVVQYDEMDHYDYTTSIQLGATLVSGDAYERYALVKLEQPSRPTTQSVDLYQPQEKLYIEAVDQTVEIVMTARASTKLGKDAFFNCPDTLAGTGATGAHVSTCAPGYVLVRNIEPFAMRKADRSAVIYLGYHMYESQDIESEPRQRDVYFDCNFVEHQEAVVKVTQDQLDLQQTKNNLVSFNWEQIETMKEFKKTIDYNALFGKRAVNYDQYNRPKYSMGGLLDVIKTNVTYYNPHSTEDFERLVLTFMTEQGFRYNPNGNTKWAFCGRNFLTNFNLAFRDFRTTNSIAPAGIGGAAGMNISSYTIPGGFTINLIYSDFLRQEYDPGDWMFLVDLAEVQWRVKRDFNSKLYIDPTKVNTNKREFQFMIEWQGSIAWHRQQSHALLRTI